VYLAKARELQVIPKRLLFSYRHVERMQEGGGEEENENASEASVVLYLEEFFFLLVGKCLRL
jgi:hypothetical protein